MLETNFRFGKVDKLTAVVEPSDERVQFESIFQNGNGGVSVLAFKAGQKLDTHLAPAEVMVLLLEGEIEFTMNDIRHNLRPGEFLLMGEGVPHSVLAMADSKVMLVKVKSTK